ncbi:MAG TPA: peptide deformylase [Betaproteobacteria bacterium]|nr:peptide deformylase [Betaproteobacteria bacterium]
MAILTVLHYPDPRLHTIASPVPAVTDEIRRLVDDMEETMRAAPGIGLAATQVNVHKQVVVIDVSESHDQPLVLINPKITASEGSCEREEGCLSVPGIYDKVTRAEWIRVEALDRGGAHFTLETDGVLAVCIQHEIDHLKGKVFVEYLSRLKQTRTRAKLTKLMRETM